MMEVAMRSALPLVLALAAVPAKAAPDDAHVRLLRQAAVAWFDVEAGGVALLVSPHLLDDPEHPTDAARADVAARAGLAVASPLTAADRARVDALLAELPAALERFLERATLAPGTYSYADRMPSDPSQPRAERAEPETLAFTAAHAKLLKALRWNGLFSNFKRPYGDMTYYAIDMAAELGEPMRQDAKGRPLFTPAEEARYDRLHQEMRPALQVFLENATLP
jgi:hypothetical protein